MKENHKYLQMALAMCGVVSDERICDLAISLYREIQKKKGHFALSDAARIQAANEKKYKPKEANND